jgi:hypothetical protein
MQALRYEFFWKKVKKRVDGLKRVDIILWCCDINDVASRICWEFWLFFSVRMSLQDRMAWCRGRIGFVCSRPWVFDALVMAIGGFSGMSS